MSRGTWTRLLLVTAITASHFSTLATAQNPPDPATAPAVELITLNFPENLELKVLVDYVSQRLGINILYDDQTINQRITIKAPAQIPKESLLGLLDSALKMKQLALMEAEQKGWMRIVPAANLSAAATPATQPGIASGAGEARVAGGIAVTQLYSIRYADLGMLDQIIKPFLTQPGGNSVILEDRRLLIVTDFASNLKRVEQLIAMIDQPAAKAVMKLVPLKNVEATAFAAQITGILTAKQAAASAKTPLAVQISADARTNQLVLIGTESAVAEAAELAASLDVPLELETKIYQFSSASPERIDRLAKELIGQAEAQRLYKSAIDDEAGLLIVTAPDAMHKKIRQLKDDLDVPAAQQQSPVRLYKLANATAGEVLKTIQAIEGNGNFTQVRFDGGSPPSGPSPTTLPSSSSGTNATAPEVPYSGSGNSIQSRKEGSDIFADEPIAARQTIKTDRATVTADPNTNTIIVIADPATQRIYEQLIKILDKRRPQVLIEAIIVAIDTSHGFNLGVEIAGADFGGDPEYITFSNFGLSRVNRNTGELSIIPGLGFNGAMLSSDLVDVVIKALATSSRARVLSSPRILVNDNATGTLSAIAEAPYASVNASDTVATTSFGGYAQAGTEITLTPHIGEGDFLQLEYSVALNNFTGDGSSNLPPPRQTNSVDSEVTIPDGHTIIVGGLNLQNTSESKTSIPFLGDIPLVEYLFSSRTINHSETTLFVFLRPIILRDDRFEDLKFLSERDTQVAGLKPEYPVSEPLVLR